MDFFVPCCLTVDSWQGWKCTDGRLHGPFQHLFTSYLFLDSFKGTFVDWRLQHVWLCLATCGPYFLGCYAVGCYRLWKEGLWQICMRIPNICLVRVRKARRDLVRLDDPPGWVCNPKPPMHCWAAKYLSGFPGQSPYGGTWKEVRRNRHPVVDITKSAIYVLELTNTITLNLQLNLLWI
jgi:hypothetical protein